MPEFPGWGEKFQKTPFILIKNKPFREKFLFFK